MKDAIFALTARSMFLLHAVLCLWKVRDVWPENAWSFTLILPILGLSAEGVYTIAMRGGEEYNWVSPCMGLYLMSVVPPIWFLEAYEYNQDMMAHVCEADWVTRSERQGCRYELGHMVGFHDRFEKINDFLKDRELKSTACIAEGLFRFDTIQFFNVTKQEPWDYTVDGFADLRVGSSHFLVFFYHLLHFCFIT